MNDRIRIGDISDSTVAVGRGAHATSTSGESPAIRRMRAELEILTDGLTQAQGEMGAQARTEVAALNNALADPSGPEIEHGWRRVRGALAALGVTGAVAFGADLSEIGNGIHEILGALGM
ncbi:hypothetical protein [Actinomycetospora chiangmaiensis]|uniref:hypothetical protein n=1 Tax=Actinomycetospora chiangmaiensis TaxID=402650 RepID=UPI00036713DB|nr:hypothetical protein [Actinomycetospora chiangmaiensis]